MIINGIEYTYKNANGAGEQMKYDGINPIEKLHPDEPYFFIRAQDKHAPCIVQKYALELMKAGDQRGCVEVNRMVKRIMEWQEANPDKVKAPD